MADAGKKQLTDQQRRALSAEGVSVALSAGAGCGKTFVLTERFLAALQPPSRAKEPLGLSQVVAITFTERAAREMRDRIRSACHQRLLDASPEDARHWLDLIRQLDSARISTIHSFCTWLLRAHAVEAELDPRFEVLDATGAQTLRYEQIDETLRGRLAAQEPGTIDLVVEFGLDRLRDMTSQMLDERGDLDWNAWTTQTPEELAKRWRTTWQAEVLPGVLQEIIESPPFKTVLRLAQSEKPDNEKMRQRCELLAQRMPGLESSSDAAGDLAEIREAAKVQGGGRASTWSSETAYAEFSGAAAELRHLIDKAAPLVGFDLDAAQTAAGTALKLLAVAAAVDTAYEARKRELAVLDFDDLILRSRSLLAGPGAKSLRRQLQGQIRLLLVDEFQDTDPAQVELVELLCGDELTKGKLFFVGDVKQSIYRFRRADPRVFVRLRQQMPSVGRMPLTLNFRSQPAILEFVNGLFREDLGPEYEPLRASRVQVGPTPAVEFLWATEGEEEERPRSGAVDRLRRLEARWIARRIRQMLDSDEKIVWDEEAARSGRPAARRVRPGDVALLFRALSNVAYYEEALRECGIDYYVVGGHAFYAQQEIYDLLNLLQSLVRPDDHVSLVGVLRSPMFSLEDETLFWLAQHRDGLAAALREAADPAAASQATAPWPLSPEQQRRVQFAAGTLAQLRAMKNRLPVAQLIQEAIERTGYDAALLAEFLGERKLANLRKLIDQARQLDRAGIFTLDDFILQLGQFVARQPDEPLAATHAESTDVVRLMSIHQSKGLEFPVVVVPDVNRKRNAASGNVAFTPQMGPMVRTSAGRGGFGLHDALEKQEDERELLRLLYVATTRAADYLILSGGLEKMDSAQSPWTELIYRRFDPASGGLRAELLPGGAPPRIRVTTEEPALDREPSGTSVRRDLLKLIEKAQQMAQGGSGRSPKLLAPVPVDQSARRQFSFSRLTGALHQVAPPSQQGVDWEEPAQLVGDPVIDPRGLGTLVHAVLADVDFAANADVDGLVRRHAPRHLSDDAKGVAQAAKMVRQFLASPRAAALAAASDRHTELEFLLSWPPPPAGVAPIARNRGGEATRGLESIPQPISPGTDAERWSAGEGQRRIGRVRGDSPSGPPAGQLIQPVTLQGFIDCLYRDAAGAWHLLDYKTTDASAKSLAKKAEPYEMQMLLYALAVEQIWGTAPAELTLCFLRPGLEYHFAWDDDARDKAIRLIDAALGGNGK